MMQGRKFQVPEGSEDGMHAGSLSINTQFQLGE